MKPLPSTEATPNRALDVDRLRAAVRADLANKINREFPGADALVNRQSVCWDSVADILQKHGRANFRPTCRIDLDPDAAVLADIFDRLMALIGDSRRAYRVEVKRATPTRQDCGVRCAS
ncbi:MAG: hypothetical protein AAFR79_16090 [Pseudomonadota bacterium]